MKLALLLSSFVIGFTSTSVFADGNPVPATTTNEPSPHLEPFDLNEPLFDFPITRALGLTVDEILLGREPDTKPKIHHLTISIVR